MPGTIRSMHLEHELRDVQTDRGSLLHGRLLRWQFDTVTLAHRCRRGASTPSPNSAIQAKRCHGVDDSGANALFDENIATARLSTRLWAGRARAAAVTTMTKCSWKGCAATSA